MSIQHRLATPVIQPRMRFFDTDGKPLVGGKVYAFKVGTEEFKPTYRNSELTALNTNPIILDGAGSALIYLRGANLLKIYDRDGNFIEERIEYQQRERAQFYDDYGRPLKNGYVYTYDYQSTIRKTSYSIDNVINPNPIALDENGTALVNIVGAYRLRQYNSKNVFVGDQDFKRPPVKALTSVVYSLYFDVWVSSHMEQSIAIATYAQLINEGLNTFFGVGGASTREVLNTLEAPAESVHTIVSVGAAQLFQKEIVYNFVDAGVDTLLSNFFVENAQITKQIGYITYITDPEILTTAIDINNAVLSE